MEFLRNTIYQFRIQKASSLAYICALLSIIVMALHVDFLPPVMILWLLVFAWEGYKKGAFFFFEKWSHLILFVVVLLFMFWQAIGVTYSDNKDVAWSKLFGRLALLVFPILLHNPGPQIKKRLSVLLKTFAISTLLFLIFCFVRAAFRSFEFVDGEWIFNPVDREFFYENYFFSADLTYKQHPSYVAMFVILSFVVALQALTDKNLAFRKRIGWLLLAVIFSGSLYFISSRAAILTGIVVTAVYFAFRLFLAGKVKLLLLITILFMIVGAWQLFKFMKSSPGNYNPVIFSEQASNKSTRDPRTLIWKSSFKILEENLLFGVGIGDVKSVLATEYEKMGEKEMAQFRMNAHNQYLETALESGIVGAGLFMTVLLIMLCIAISERNPIYISFILTVLIMMMFESILYRFAGVAFFSLFSFLLPHLPASDNYSESTLSKSP